MAERIREIMASNVVTLRQDTSVTEAARAMRDSDIGDVIVVDEGERLQGILTDRDIVVRAIADGRDPAAVKVGEICSGEVATLSPDDRLEHAVNLMRDRAVRRVPVVEGERAIGIVSIGDLAIERDEGSALADVSAERPNR
jgi:CBS domain-containing protein